MRGTTQSRFILVRSIVNVSTYIPHSVTARKSQVDSALDDIELPSGTPTSRSQTFLGSYIRDIYQGRSSANDVAAYRRGVAQPLSTWRGHPYDRILYAPAPEVPSQEDGPSFMNSDLGPPAVPSPQSFPNEMFYGSQNPVPNINHIFGSQLPQMHGQRPLREGFRHESMKPVMGTPTRPTNTKISRSTSLSAMTYLDVEKGTGRAWNASRRNSSPH